jgi:hypothetical protein
MVNYHHDMWKGRSELCAPLSSLTSKKVKWLWTDVHQVTFDGMKKAIARDTILAYSDFN